MATTEELLQTILQSLEKVEYIKSEDIPNIDLYMDQVLTFMDRKLRSAVRPQTEDRVLTKTMINNYAKNDLLPPPVKKKYSRVHLALLMIICTLKQTLNISVVKDMLPDWDGDAVRRFYDRFITVQKGFGAYFVNQVRAAAEPIFAGGDEADAEVTDFIISAAVASCYAKLLTEKMIIYKNE